MAQENGTQVGIAAEVKGEATITHANGEHESLKAGMPVFLDDTIETSQDGGVNITFNDETVFAVSDNAVMTIDEFVYDPAKDGEGRADISVERGAFAYTSGFVGKEDPTDVTIKTPVGSIDIRGTIITGFVPEAGSDQPMQVTLIEGAIAVFPNAGGEFFMNQPRDTIQIDAHTHVGERLGQLPAEDLLDTYTVTRSVAPKLYSTLLEGEHSGAPSPNGVGTDGVQPEGHDAVAPDSQTTPTTDDSSSDTNSPTESETVALQDAATQEPVVQQDKPLLQDNSLTGDSLLQTTLDHPILDSVGDGALLPLLGDGKLVTLLDSPLLPLLQSATGGTDTTVDGTTGTPPTLGDGTVVYDPSAHINHNPFARDPASMHHADDQGGLAGGTYYYNVSSFFGDIDGDPLHYAVGVVGGVGVPPVSNVSVSDAGLLKFTVDAALGANTTVQFAIKAIDELGAESAGKTFDFKLFQDNPAGVTVTNPTIVISVGQHQFSSGAGDDSITVQTNNNAIFAGTDNDTINILNKSSNSVYGESGVDTIYLSGASATNNILSGGIGDDTLVASSLNTFTSHGNALFGGAGKDVFKLDDSAATLLSGSNMTIDGGTGVDKITLLDVNNLNLIGINGSKLFGIDKIAVDGVADSTLTTHIRLDLDAVLRNTDDKKMTIDLGDAFGNDILHIDDLANWTVASHTSAGTTFSTTYEKGGATLYVSGHIGDTVVAA